MINASYITRQGKARNYTPRVIGREWKILWANHLCLTKSWKSSIQVSKQNSSCVPQFPVKHRTRNQKLQSDRYLQSSLKEHETDIGSSRGTQVPT